MAGCIEHDLRTPDDTVSTVCPVSLSKSALPRIGLSQVLTVVCDMLVETEPSVPASNFPLIPVLITGETRLRHIQDDPSDDVAAENYSQRRASTYAFPAVIILSNGHDGDKRYYHRWCYYLTN